MRAITRAVAPVIVILACWEIAIYTSGLPGFVLPRPEQVAVALYKNRVSIGENLGATLVVALGGYAAANVISIILAVLLLYVPSTENAIMPAAIWIRNIPFVALAPILLLMIGDNPLSKILVVILACFFPVLVNTAQGLRNADAVILDRMHVLNASEWEIFWNVRFFYALDLFIAAQKIVITLSVIVAIAAEWLTSSVGLGYLLNRFLSQYEGDGVYAVSIVAATVSILLFVLVQKAEAVLLPWKQNAKN